MTKHTSENTPDDQQRRRLKTTEFHLVQNRNLRKARTYLYEAKRYNSNQLYFDCLTRLEDSMLCINEQPLTQELKSSDHALYEHVLECYIQSANAYIGLQQYENALNNCHTILQAEENTQVYILKATAHEALGHTTDAIECYKKALSQAIG